MRFLFRLLALPSLAVSVIAAVTDVSRSLAASALIVTSLGKGWADLWPGSLAAAQSAIQGHTPLFVYDPLFLTLLSLPAAAVFAVLAACLYAIGAKRTRPFGAFTAR